jgi:hypothetical protein
MTGCRFVRDSACPKSKCDRCTGITKTGQVCKLRTCIRLPYCFIHARKILYLEVKSSTIPNGGCGLFTTKDRSKNDKIAEYIGESLSVSEYKTRYPHENGKYVLQIKKGLYSNAKCIRGIAAMANTKKNKSDCNAFFSVSFKTGTASLKLSKNIKQGDEIFVYYGKEYKL